MGSDSERARDAKQRLLEALEFQRRFDARFAAIERRTRFDATHGLDTESPVPVWDLPDADDFSVEHAARYSPTPVPTIRAVIRASPIRPDGVTFVDFGCGKGRVLLVASEFPFKRIVGVEFSRSLCDVARRNIDRFRSEAQRCRSVDLYCQNAIDFPIPDDAGLFYFYEPFSTTVAAAVLANIEAALRRHPRDAVLCFVGRGQPDRERPPGAEGQPLVASVVRGSAHWKEHAMVPSPDDRFYDAWLFVHARDGVGR